MSGLHQSHEWIDKDPNNLPDPEIAADRIPGSDQLGALVPDPLP